MITNLNFFTLIGQLKLKRDDLKRRNFDSDNEQEHNLKHQGRPFFLENINDKRMIREADEAFEINIHLTREMNSNDHILKLREMNSNDSKLKSEH